MYIIEQMSSILDCVWSGSVWQHRCVSYLAGLGTQLGMSLVDMSFFSRCVFSLVLSLQTVPMCFSLKNGFYMTVSGGVDVTISTWLKMYKRGSFRSMTLTWLDNDIHREIKWSTRKEPCKKNPSVSPLGCVSHKSPLWMNRHRLHLCIWFAESWQLLGMLTGTA